MLSKTLVLLVLPALASAQDFWATDAGYSWFVHLPTESEQINATSFEKKVVVVVGVI